MSISMRLRFNICDVDMQLKINDWSKPDFEEEWNDNWCDVELKFQSKYLNYDPSGELLMSSDVIYLEDALGMLLDGTLLEDGSVRFTEPDLQFDLYVAKRLYDIPGKVCFRDGYKDVDISANFTIQFWYSGGLGSNTFNMILDRKEITELYHYLNLVTGKLKEDDLIIIDMINRGVLVKN